MLNYSSELGKLSEGSGSRSYPRADFQLCTIHASRNFESHVRVQDRNEIDSEMLLIS